MATPWADLLHCSLGGVNFQLLDYAVSEEAIVKEGQGKTGVNLTVTGDGEVTGATAAEFAANLVAVSGALRSSGRDFTVYGLSGLAEYSIAAAACLDGSPHVSMEILPQASGPALRKHVRFKITAKTGPDQGGSQPANSYKVKVTTRPDHLRGVSISGELTGPGVTAYFNSTVLVFFINRYPTTQWVPTIDFDSNVQDDSATYTLSFAELAAPLPDDGGGNVAVDGVAVDSVERDEQQRLIQTKSFDFLVVGDPIKLRDLMRSQLGGTPFRERYEVTAFKEVRVRGEFQLLAGGNGNDLMNWSRSIAAQEQQTDTFEAFAIPGAEPVFVKKPGVGFIYIDSGRAIGAGRFPKPPSPIYQTYGAASEQTFEHLNEVEKQTSWKYTYLLDKVIEDPKAYQAKLGRPDAPEFYTQPPAAAAGVT